MFGADGETDEDRRYTRRMIFSFVGALSAIALVAAIFFLVAYMTVPL
jgi:hypothetical protein